MHAWIIILKRKYVRLLIDNGSTKLNLFLPTSLFKRTEQVTKVSDDKLDRIGGPINIEYAIERSMKPFLDVAVTDHPVGLYCGNTMHITFAVSNYCGYLPEQKRFICVKYRNTTINHVQDVTFIRTTLRIKYECKPKNERKRPNTGNTYTVNGNIQLAEEQ